MLRIEAIDPFGATHSLMILDAAQKFTWLDYDRNETYEMRSSWHGLPLAKLPELVLGIAAPPEGAHLAKADTPSGDGFVATLGRNTFKYDMTWIDPGPRLALKGLVGEINEGVPRPERYVVAYSKYLDTAEFYLPEEIKLSGFSSATLKEPDVEVQISWRERAWNEPVAPKIFVAPSLNRK